MINKILGRLSNRQDQDNPMQKYREMIEKLDDSELMFLCSSFGKHMLRGEMNRRQQAKR